MIEGPASKLAIHIGVCREHFYQYTTLGKKIKNDWRTEVIYGEKGVSKDGISLKTAIEWDAFTEPIRQYIRRRDNAKKKQ